MKAAETQKPCLLGCHLYNARPVPIQHAIQQARC
jgi:hypothetical protein